MNYRDFSLSLAEGLVRAQIEAGDHPAGGPRQPPPPFTITISREAGALGSAVAAELGRLLGWPVYDRNILDKVAEHCRRPPSRVGVADERPPTWLAECISALVDRDHVSYDAYLKHLSAVVRGLGASGQCVIVGRGANFLLPPESTLSVRLVAPPKVRADIVARRLGLSPRDAEVWMKETDRERAAFCRRAFERDPADPLHYDLTLNVSRLSAAEAAGVIIETLRRREEGRDAPASARKQQASAAQAEEEKAAATEKTPAFV